MATEPDTLFDYQLGPATRFVRRIGTRLLYRLFIRRQLLSVDIFKIYGFSIRVYPSVFHPLFFRSSAYFAELLLRSLDLDNRRVLDVGCGSGILSLICARLGAHVVAVDINPDAVRCTRENAALNGLKDCIEVFVSDLFENIPRGKLFDYIIANPPFFRAEPHSVADFAWKTNPEQPFLKRLAAGAKTHLAKNGQVLCLLSSDADVDREIKEFEQSGFMWTMIGSKRFMFEKLYLFRFVPNQLTSGSLGVREDFDAKERST